jgi:hypothetical protein
MSNKTKKPKSIKVKTVEEVKKDVEKIVFPGYNIPAQPAVIDEQIKTAAGFTLVQLPVANFNFVGKTIPFFYLRSLDDKTDLNTSTRQYFNDIKNRLKQALGIPQTIKKLSDIIEVIDRPQIENNDNLNWRNLVPRGKKLNRLKVVYEILLKFTLEMIHNFYWVDFLKVNMGPNNAIVSVDQNTNIHNINHYIERFTNFITIKKFIRTRS